MKRRHVEYAAVAAKATAAVESSYAAGRLSPRLREYALNNIARWLARRTAARPARAAA